ncbi:hypothetical protein [Chryseobacterium angstadtii]|uniref:hypothetical protein n=1 Tax=Chryseobacterium angstadtii TaxID=558151 RepID=UPI00065AED9F|nr:hypothetical protein [Chryseobacterium angstadtii]
MKRIFSVGIVLFTCNTHVLSQVGIGTKQPDPSSILHLDVSSLPTEGKKGFLAPKVSLQSSIDQVTIPLPAVGLLVYNLGTGNLKTEGYHYWNGTEWRAFTSSSTISPSIAGFDCANAYFSPPFFTAGMPYSGTMVVPYTGGNGGSYPSGAPVASTGNTGLTATLRPGVLTNGKGELVYDLSGTPAQSSPSTAFFNLNFLGKSCQAAISGDVLQLGQTQSYYGKIRMNDMASYQLASEFLADLPVIEGLQMNLMKNGSMDYTYIIKVKNITGLPIDVKVQVKGFSGSPSYKEMNIGTGQVVELSSMFGHMHNTDPDLIEINLIINDRRWYRISYFVVSDYNVPSSSNNYHHIRMTIQRVQ